MFESRIERLHNQVLAYVAAFDPVEVSPAQAAVVVEVVTGMKASLSALEALAAARAADADTWKQEGHRSAAEALARKTGTTVGQARDTLQLGRRLGQQPEIAEAAKAGQISPTQASLIADAAAGRLLEEARRGSVATLRQACADAKATAGPDPEARRRRHHARRCLRQWTDADGQWHLVAHGLPEEGAQLMSVLAPLADARFHQARKEGRRERPDAYAYDALIELAKRCAAEDLSPATRRERRRGAPVKLLIRVDYDTWLRGFPVEGETCELVGYGPVSMAAVKQLVETGDPFVVAVLTRAKQVVGVAHLGRKPTAFQRSAWEWLHPRCDVDSCPVPGSHLEMDHRDDWAATHVTALDGLDGPCPHHHRLKTRAGWAFVHGDGKRAFVAPTDPRHPRNQTATRAARC
jgi:hypothetical protein